MPQVPVSVKRKTELKDVGPTFEAGPCPFPTGAIPAGERVVCGSLIVPEDRARPDAGAIRLAVAILRTYNPERPDYPDRVKAVMEMLGAVDQRTQLVLN